MGICLNYQNKNFRKNRINMADYAIRAEYSRLLGPQDIVTMVESYSIITNAAFTIMYEHGKEGWQFDYDHDANLLFQMTILKGLSVLKLSNPINYINPINGSQLLNTYDPFSTYNLVRAQFEAFCNFNNIYIQSENLESLQLKYKLWVLSGLNYRQRFKVETEENIKKKDKEKNQIETLIGEIENNSVFDQLEEQSQKNIRDAIKKREWQLQINGSKAYKIAWHQMMTNAGVNDSLEDQYTFLSLATHPSNVSVFQFGSMYNENMQEFNQRMALQVSKIFLSMFVRDYCNYFPSCKNTFNKLPSICQLLINSYNSMFRSEDYVLNEHYKDV